MKANELMIGDWVLDGKKPAQITGIMCDDLFETTISPSVGGECISPISLTPEILKKNGFKENKYGEMILDEELGTSEIYLVLEPNYDNAYYWWTVNSELIAKIKSVHELQHTLKLCRIEKEIEI